MKKLIDFLVLPRDITDFERRYLERVNRIALHFFAAHIPVMMLVAFVNHTRPFVAAALAALVVAGPLVAFRGLVNPRAVSIVHGVAAMCMGGLLVHFGQGPVQIEMHFYFFALVAMCAVFGNPLVVVAAAATVALHHLVVWLFLPASVFNYEASWWVVGVHAAFVVLESVATCFIARSFFDNVIGLEKIVQARTREIRMLLDNVDQGFLTIDLDGNLSTERSAAVDRLFGAFDAGTSWFDLLARVSKPVAEEARVAWDEVRADIMPLELTLDQLPKCLEIGPATYRLDHRPIGTAPHERFLVIVTDITSVLARERSESERRDTFAIFERVLADRSGFEMFHDESCAIVDALQSGRCDEVDAKRLVHTLKGNAASFGLENFARMCHSVEDRIESREVISGLVGQWERVAQDIEKLLGTERRTLEIEPADYDALVAAIRKDGDRALVLRAESLKLESSRKRLAHVGDQAKRIAERLGKRIEIVTVDEGVRLDAQRFAPVWSTFIHAIRNAVDHGIELPEARVAAGKPACGTITLRTSRERGAVVVELADDGAGIDWDAIRERARAVSLPCDTDEDLERALFVDGLSTAPIVTEISGRGIGMGALLEATEALGGTIVVRSRRGVETRLRMTIPDAVTQLAQPARDQSRNFITPVSVV